jgi:Ca2+-transporting ATPase
VSDPDDPHDGDASGTHDAPERGDGSRHGDHERGPDHDGDPGDGDWHARSPEATLAALGSDREGLSAPAVTERRARHGPNELTADEERSPLSVLVEQFASPLIWLLLAAAGVSLVVGHLVDAALIAVIVTANGVFGFLQEYRAERSLAALRDLAEPAVTVRRAGTERTVETTELVPGDVVVLETGAVVPADARLLSATDLEVDESALTGESVPVSKGVEAVPADVPLAERASLVHRGTSVTRGRATAVVVATGMDTEVGAIATQLETTTDRTTPLGRDLAALGRRLGVGVVALSLVVVPVLVAGGTALEQAGLTAISLAVAAVPEGLPAVLTLTLALGVRRMADENALVRRLTAVEALGSVDVVCTDKTGTITTGEMRATRAWLFDEHVDLAGEDAGDRLRRLLTAGALCSDATVDAGEPTERALVRAAADAGIDVAERRANTPRRDERPFSSERRRMATVHDDAVYVKGAPETVLDRCVSVRTAEGSVPLSERHRERVETALSAMTADALRVLAVATKTPDGGDPETELTLLGLVGLLDPPRDEVRAAVADTHRAGIRVTMITGDAPETAREVARQVGIGTGDADTGTDTRPVTPDGDGPATPGRRGAGDGGRDVETGTGSASAGDDAGERAVGTGEDGHGRGETGTGAGGDGGVDRASDGDGPAVLTGSDVAAMDDDQLRASVASVRVFARVAPEQKVRILRALQAGGHTVAMTGDGVNDAPALKHADVGVAMGVRGTDVAKGASDLVLLDDNYATIRTAIRRGRTVFDNVWKFVAYLLSANAAEVALVLLASLYGYLILPPVQLLWINLLTDGLPALALGSDPGGEGVMDRPPRTETGVIDRSMLAFVAGAAVVVTAVLSGVGLDALDGAASATPYAVTMVFTGFVVFEFGKLYVVRWMRGTSPLSNPWLAGTVLVSFSLHLTVLYTPLRDAFGTVALDAGDWTILGGALLGTLPLLAGVAVLANRVRRPRTTGESE